MVDRGFLEGQCGCRETQRKGDKELKLRIQSAWQAILGFVKRAWEHIQPMLPGVAIAVVCIDLIGVILPSAIVVGAVLSGMVASISLLFVVSNLPLGIRLTVVKLVARYGYLVDAVATVFLTLWGFQLSVTLGIVAMVIGLHISGIVSVFRWLNRWLICREMQAL